MSKAIVIPDSMDDLPYNDCLGWEKYQVFCTDILHLLYDGVDSREYLLKGSKQNGIDIYSIPKGNEKMTVAQCKLVEYLSPKKTIDIVDDFLKGNLVEKTKVFILCTSADLGRQKDEDETITIARAKLAQRNIDLVVWDERGMSTALRTNPTPHIIHTVARYFGGEIALKFYGDVWKNYLRKIRQIDKLSYELPPDHIDRTISSFHGKFDIYQSYQWAQLRSEKKQTIVNLFELTRGKKGIRAVLLSIAGFGKTMEINHVAGFFSNETKFYYPIKFSLCNYRGQTIEILLDNFNPEWRNICEETLLLIFDGIDEITDNNDKKFIQSLNAFVEIHPDANILISSRFNSYNLKIEPLKGFQVYILDPLTQKDIDNYLDIKLEEKKDDFIKLIHIRNFSEFNQNPYYLTRLVRFYNSDVLSFPRNKSELFDKILFEQLDNDKSRYNIPELKEKLLPLALQLAFCMTLSGKSNLNDDEVKQILPNAEMRASLTHFSILVRNDTNNGSWSFEHKNLQEYLCASCLMEKDFNEIHNLISFAFAPNKLIPHFLNTVSFLFEIIDKDSLLFKELFKWLNANEPELLIRFEKAQISRATRFEIFVGVFNYYKKKNTSLRFTSNFLIGELAQFVEIDNDVIDFISNELDCQLPVGLAKDAIRMLADITKPYLYRAKLNNIAFKCLKSKEYIFLQGACINLLNDLGFTDKQQFNKIIESGIDIENFENRRAIINILKGSDYYEDYIDLIIGSIKIFVEGEKEMSYGAKYGLANLILKFDKPESIKKLFQYFVVNKHCVSQRFHHHEFQFKHDELEILLKKAKDIFNYDRSILRLVYRLFRSLNIEVYQNIPFKFFEDFFAKTCGVDAIFKKIYKHSKIGHDFLPFANENCCLFLLDEYKAKKISDKEMIIYRNSLSHRSNDLFMFLYERLLLISAEKFQIDDLCFDYGQARKTQEIKNQQMLLNRDLFFEEAYEIFRIVQKDNISGKDLWYSENKELRRLEHSIAYEKIKNLCLTNDDKIITQQEFVEKYSSKDEWEWFVIESISDLLKHSEKLVIDNRLIAIIKGWCREKIDTIDFRNSIIDKPDGSFNYIPIVEYIKDMILLIDMELSDEVLVNLLLSDYNTFISHREGEKSIGAYVIEKVSNKDFLKTAILNNIKNGNLARYVLCSHYQLCNELSYRDCKGDLYSSIVTNPLLNDSNKISLTKFYLNLGGDIADFVDLLSIPDRKSEEQVYSSWAWYLIDSLREVDSNKVIDILLSILDDSEQNESNKINACEQLIWLSRIEGLQYLASYIKEHKKLPFEHRVELLSERVKKMPEIESCDIVLDLLDYVYEFGLNVRMRRPDSVEDILFGMLFSMAVASFTTYTLIKEAIEKLITKYSAEPFVDTLRFSLDRLSQTFYEKHNSELSLSQANNIYTHAFLSRSNSTA